MERDESKPVKRKGKGPKMETIKTKSEPEVKRTSLGGDKKMKLKELAEQLGWELKTQNVPVEAEVQTGYASDLLSDVLANSIEGDLWVTRQTHLNIVAIAVMRDLSGILLVNGAQPGPRHRGEGRRKDGPHFSDSSSHF